MKVTEAPGEHERDASPKGPQLRRRASLQAAPTSLTRLISNAKQRELCELGHKKSSGCLTFTFKSAQLTCDSFRPTTYLNGNQTKHESSNRGSGSHTNSFVANPGRLHLPLQNFRNENCALPACPVRAVRKASHPLVTLKFG